MKKIVGKVVIIGHQGVGKTSTVIRYVEDSFNHHISPTVGASFFTREVEIDGINVKLQIWDTAGQERFKAITPMFYRNANAAIVVFDITSEASFDSMKQWVLDLRKNITEHIILCVVGNKIDLVKDRKVSRDVALQYSESIGASYFECSAMKDLGVALIFENIARGLVRLLASENVNHLKVYDNENIQDIMAKSSDLEATDVGKEETVHLSINSIAHGSIVRSNCC